MLILQLVVAEMKSDLGVGQQLSLQALDIIAQSELRKAVQSYCGLLKQ